MRPRFLETSFAALCLGLLLATAARGDTGSPWEAHPQMGRCFADAPAFIRAAFGEAGLEDENIRSRPAKPLKDGSVWVIDYTPGTNYQWHLLQPGEGGQVCLTLFVPAAAQVELSQKGREWTAKAKTQASPGLPAKQVEFKRPAGQGRFSAVACQEIDYTKSQAGSRRKVDCATVFD
ncbi:hypothetical protein [Pyxidicoccus caerfyrddinensis]|jgi:hypothetical protein|uniref:hypothetical protein n=1 Tax=Pyxidicoccus caerfyrddinensis TaxID=2709663 RepID=UPI0013D99A12|nr:hypothetical protein [Pyxidicoccus caerfyrddinensis]